MFLIVSLAFIASVSPINITVPDESLVKRYQATWESLDTRPLPRWYDEAKVGIFLHWGIYSVPGVGNEWFWYFWKTGGYKNVVNFMKNNYPPDFRYQDFAPMFKAEFFDPKMWAKLFVNSGAKYVVLTSKHHDGFTLFPSKQSPNWNSVDVGPKRDLVGELAKAVREEGLKFGVYYSLYEWFNPLFLEDKKRKFQTINYVINKTMKDLKQLVINYKPSVVWADGDGDAEDSYWHSTTFLAWLYNLSPVRDEVVVNDRWGKDQFGKHGDFYNYADKFNDRTLYNHKWENAFPIDRLSWGYRKVMQLSDMYSIVGIINELVTTVSCGGNVLINVGPTKEGTIPLIFQERLLALGKWLDVNGEAIYKTSPWLTQNDTLNGKVWYTCVKAEYNALRPTAIPTYRDNILVVYAITLKWPADNILKLQDISPYLQTGNYRVELLGMEGILTWWISNGMTEILFPDKSTVVSKHAWTLKIWK